MLNRTDKIRAFKEACIDTSIGMATNVPLNYVMLLVAFEYKFTALTTTMLMTAVFTTVAVGRKYYIRTRMETKYRKTAR